MDKEKQFQSRKFFTPEAETFIFIEIWCA